MTPRSEVVQRLRAAGCVWAEDEADLLLASGGDVDAKVARREAGEPLEVVLGYATLAGVRVELDPGVFVPRRRSELLVRLARDRAAALDTPLVVDLCCGSGAVGAAVVTGLPGAVLHAADVDPGAVACARRNVEPLGGSVHLGDLYVALPTGLRGAFIVGDVAIEKFRLLAAGFFVCGFQIAFITTHFPAYIQDMGMDPKWGVTTLMLARNARSTLTLQALDGTEAYTRGGSLEVSNDGTLTTRSGLPVVPNRCDANNTNHNNSVSYTAKPDGFFVFCKGIKLVANTQTLTLGPGIYVISGDAFTINSGWTIKATNATIYFTRDSNGYATLKVNGQNTMNLTPPTSGITNRPASSMTTTPGSVALDASSGAMMRVVAPRARWLTIRSHSAQAWGSSSDAGPS